MGIVNKRNAMLGWTAWKIAKKVLKRKAKAAVPGTAEGGRMPGKAFAAVVAAIVGVLWFWRRGDGDGTEDATGD